MRGKNSFFLHNCTFDFNCFCNFYNRLCTFIIFSHVFIYFYIYFHCYYVGQRYLLFSEYHFNGTERLSSSFVLLYNLHRPLWVNRFLSSWLAFSSVILMMTSKFRSTHETKYSFWERPHCVGGNILIIMFIWV